MIPRSAFKIGQMLGLLGLFWADLALFPNIAQARPVSYADSWTLMLKNDGLQNSAHIHYTPDRKHSIGLRLRYDREGEFTFVGAQINRLAKRWNKAESQANLYVKSAIGRVIDDSYTHDIRTDRDDATGFMLGLASDWETRRYFVSAELEHWEQGEFGGQTALHGRLGIAPYVANTGALHTWLMVEGHYSSNTRDEQSLSALIRLFKGPSLLELGLKDDGEPILNYFHRF